MTSVCLLQLNTYCEGVLLMEIKARMNEETNLLGSRMLFRHTNFNNYYKKKVPSSELMFFCFFLILKSRGSEE